MVLEHWIITETFSKVNKIIILDRNNWFLKFKINIWKKCHIYFINVEFEPVELSNSIENLLIKKVGKESFYHVFFLNITNS